MLAAKVEGQLVKAGPESPETAQCPACPFSQVLFAAKSGLMEEWEGRCPPELRSAPDTVAVYYVLHHCTDERWEFDPG
jgi:hypothetical protein